MFTIPPEIWGIISIVLALVSLVPYVWVTLKGTNKPHLFSWIIWTLLTGIAFALQYSEGAGAGAWSGFVTTILSLIITILAIKYGEKNITRSDWVVFIAALAAIPLWLMTDNALLAVIWVSVIDSIGFIPTFRKSWHKPYEEMLFHSIVATIKYITILLALEIVSPSTLIYTVSMLVMNGLLVAMLIYRRWVINNKS